MNERERFHRERKSYSLPTGVMGAETIQNVARYLDDVQRGWNTDELPAKLPTVSDMSETMLAEPSVADWLECGGSFAIDDAVRKHLDSLGMPSSPVNSHSCYPSRNISGPDSAARLKNIQAGIKQWHRWMTDRAPRVSPLYHHVYLQHLEPLGMDWTVTGKGDYVGTYPKRLSKFLAKQHGMKLRPAQIETIGNIGAASVSRTAEYAITFDRDYLTGTDCEYGNSGSCWWGSNSGARHMLYENGGYAVRVWRTDGYRPAARCWLAPHDDFYVLFNAYGTLSLWEFARVLSHSWGWSYRQCGDLSNYGEHGGILYINGGNGIIIGPADVVNALDESPTVDFQWYDVDGDSCSDCGCGIDPDYSCSDPDGNSICEDCYSNNYSSCERCGDVFTHDDIINCEDSCYCERCAARQGYARCDDCSEWRSDLEETTDGRDVCESCGEDYSRCEECETLASDTAETVDGNCVCESCAGEFAECDDCGKLASETAETTGGESVCQRCGDRSYERCGDCGFLAREYAETGNGKTVCGGCQADYRECSDCGELVSAERTLFPLCGCEHTSVTVS